MSQRDLVAELRAAEVEAPSEVRERVRLIAAGDTSQPRRRFTWRRALVVAVPVAAAVAATVVFTRPAHQQAATRTVRQEVHGAAAKAPALRAAKSFAVPSARNRVQTYDATLGLRVRSVSDAVKRALRITTSLAGYPAGVHAQLSSANLTLKVPRTHVELAVTRLAALGTITAERIDITDRQAGLNAADRTIARLQTELAALRAETPPDTGKIAALVARIRKLQRGEAETRRAAHYATVRLQLDGTQHAAKGHTWRNVFHAAGWAAAGAGALAVVLLAMRLLRRRREDVLLSR